MTVLRSLAHFNVDKQLRASTFSLRQSEELQGTVRPGLSHQHRQERRQGGRRHGVCPAGRHRAVPEVRPTPLSTLSTFTFSPDLIPEFLSMIHRVGRPQPGASPRVYVLNVFEISGGHDLPTNKSQLASLLQAGPRCPSTRRSVLSATTLPGTSRQH